MYQKKKLFCKTWFFDQNFDRKTLISLKVKTIIKRSQVGFVEHYVQNF